MNDFELERSRLQTAWIGPLPKYCSRNQIMTFFEKYDPLDCQIFTENNGFAFVYFATQFDRNNAISNLNGKFLNGTKVVVNRSFNAFRGPRLVFDTNSELPYLHRAYNPYDDISPDYDDFDDYDDSDDF